VAVAAGDLAGARAAYQAGLDIRVRLAAADPANALWQSDLAYVQRRIGELSDGTGQLPPGDPAVDRGDVPGSG
jgi:hypothetical protein